MTSTGTEGGKAADLPALDGVRGIACLMVVAAHVVVFVPEPDMRAAPWASGVGGIALASFFVLSGYLIARPFVAAAIAGRAVTGATLRRYAKRRALRILPAYLAITVLAWAFVIEPRAPGGDLLASVLLVQNLSPETLLTIVPPTWTVVVEAQFYVLLPLLLVPLGRLVRPTPAWLVAGVVAAAAAALGVLASAWSVATELTLVPAKNLPALMPSFAVGILIAVADVSGRGRWIGAWPRWARVAVLAATPPLFVYWLEGDRALELHYFNVAALATAPLIAGEVFGPRERRLGALLAAPAIWLGERSYSIYLLHMPVIVLLVDAGILGPFSFGSYLPAVAITVIATVALAVPSHALLERPFIGRRRVPARTPALVQRPLPE